LDVVYLFQWLFQVFSGVLHVFQTQASSVSFVFIRTLQMLHLDILKIVQVLLLWPTSRSRRLGGEVEGARVVFVWGQEARVTFGRTWAPMWRVSGHTSIRTSGR
jgi:hypothetical protein